jgi:hypothetical protein
VTSVSSPVQTTPTQPNRLPSKTTVNVPMFDIAANTTDLILDEKTTAIGEGLAITAFSFEIGARRWSTGFSLRHAQSSIKPQRTRRA